MSAHLVTERLAAWRAALSASGSEPRLRQRWRFLGWPEEEARARLAGESLFATSSYPEAEEWQARALGRFEAGEAGVLQDGIPFAEIFAIWAEEALRKVPPGGDFFRADLVARLGELAAPALLGELRAQADEGGSPRDRYERFLIALRKGGLRSLFRRLPVLAGQIANLLHFARETAVEFLGRLAADREWLRIRFPGAEGEMVQLETNGGDAHRGGRRVMIVTFATGRRVVYKPRNLRMDMAWRGLLQWVRSRDARCTLQAPEVLERAEYGWMDFVEPGRPQDLAEYYRQAGELVALAWVCGGSDFHEENIIATAHGPVLVDLETLFTPWPRPFDATEANLEAANGEELFHSSVLSTLLLPVWEVDEQGRARDLSGLTGQEGESALWQELQWVELGTSRMRREMRPTRRREPRNIPRDAGGRLVAATAYVGEILEGFRTGARALLEQKERVPLEAFRGAEIRFLVRATQVYGIMKERLRDPRFLASAADRSIEMEKLSRPFFPLETSAPEPDKFRCYEAERRGLEQDDIPVFRGRTDETNLRGDGGIIVRNYFWKTGWEIVQQKLALLDEALIEEQASLVRSSLELRYEPAASEPPVDLLGAATAMAEDLARRAIPLRTGGVSWLSLDIDPLRKMQFASRMGLDLYSGALGVAIFLAGLGHVSKDTRWKALAREATRPRLDQVRAKNARILLGRMSLGIGSGLGSLVLGCQALANLLDDESYLDDAKFFAELMRGRPPGMSGTYDVLGGEAGAIIALLSLHGKNQDSRLLETAAALGEHLLAARVEAAGGQRVWQPAFASAPLTGLGHGAAGFTLALQQLGTITGSAHFIEAAGEALAYERTVFDPEASDWPDFRRNAAKLGERVFMHGWCAGGPGIGLARLAQFGDEDPAAREEVETAIAGARQRAPLAACHLCCGQSARVELLLEASRLKGRGALRAEAAAQAARMIEGRRLAGFFALNGADQGRLFAPSFFQGFSGLGYTLLCLRDGTLPSIALLQAEFRSEQGLAEAPASIGFEGARDSG